MTAKAARSSTLPSHHRERKQVWGGLGIVLVALIGRLVFGQHIDAAGMAGIGLIVAGVIVLNLFSSSVSH